MDSSPQAAVAREASFPHLLLLVFAGAGAAMTQSCLWERNIVFRPRVPSPCSMFHGFLITHWVICGGNEFQEKAKLRIQPCVLVLIGAFLVFCFSGETRKEDMSHLVVFLSLPHAENKTAPSV